MGMPTSSVSVFALVTAARFPHTNETLPSTVFRKDLHREHGIIGGDIAGPRWK